MGVGNHDRTARTVPAARATGTRAGAARVSLWRQVTAGCGPDAVAVRYATLARVRAGRAGPAAFARSAREDVARLAAALGAVLELHTPDHWHHCRACTAGQFLVGWPCRTRRTIDHGLDHGWPPNPAAPTGPADSGEPNAPDGPDRPDRRIG